MKLILNAVAPGITCACGRTFASVADALRHVNAIECPRQPPENEDAYATLSWATGVGRACLAEPRNETEREKLEIRKEKARQLADNPIYSENRRRKIELARLERQRKGFFTTNEREQLRCAKARHVDVASPATIKQGDLAMQNETNVASATKSDVKPAAKPKAVKAPRVAKPKAEKKPKAPKAPRAPKVKKEAGPKITDHTPVGTMLRRDYKGGKVEVEVLASGFRVNEGPGATKGKTYMSLAACVEAIVGYRISGHNFFGMWLGKGKTVDATKAKEIAAKEKQEKKEAEERAAREKKEAEEKAKADAKAKAEAKEKKADK